MAEGKLNRAARLWARKSPDRDGYGKLDQNRAKQNRKARARVRRRMERTSRRKNRR